MGLLNWLFDTSFFVSRNNCGPGWTDTLVWSYILASGMIALAYFFIPAFLGRLWHEGKEFAPTGILVFFMAFITFCGITHVNDVLVFFWPAYRWFTLCMWSAAIASAATAIMLPTVVHKALRMAQENKKLHQSLEMRRDELESINASLHEIIKNEMWKHDTVGMLNKMKEMMRDVSTVWTAEIFKN